MFGSLFPSASNGQSQIQAEKKNKHVKNIADPKDHWTLKTSYFEDPTPAIQVQTLPLEGPRSLGESKFSGAALFQILDDGDGECTLEEIRQIFQARWRRVFPLIMWGIYKVGNNQLIMDL